VPDLLRSVELCLQAERPVVAELAHVAIVAASRNSNSLLTELRLPCGASACG
jgi:hypothetical protein